MHEMNDGLAMGAAEICCSANMWGKETQQQQQPPPPQRLQ